MLPPGKASLLSAAVPIISIIELLNFKQQIVQFTRWNGRNEYSIRSLTQGFGIFPFSHFLRRKKIGTVLFSLGELLSTSTQLERNVVFDIIYYIYHPIATKLPSTRKSTWLNPVVGEKDALRLRGFKLVEPASFEKVWRLVGQHTIEEKFNKNTPEP